MIKTIHAIRMDKAEKNGLIITYFIFIILTIIYFMDGFKWLLNL